MITGGAKRMPDEDARRQPFAKWNIQQLSIFALGPMPERIEMKNKQKTPSGDFCFFIAHESIQKSIK
jgi:hypothetical protein